MPEKIEKMTMASNLIDEKARLDELLLNEELYWKQRAKAFWLEEGDTNSKSFHAIASSMKKMTHIPSLKVKSDDGRVVSKHEELCCLLKNYYISIFVVFKRVAEYPYNEEEVRVSDV